VVTQCVASALPVNPSGAGTALNLASKIDKTPVVTASVSEPEPKFSTPKSEVAVVSKPPPTPSMEPPNLGTQAIGTPQVTVEPVVPTVVVQPATYHS